MGGRKKKKESSRVKEGRRKRKQGRKGERKEGGREGKKEGRKQKKEEGGREWELFKKPACMLRSPFMFSLWNIKTKKNVGLAPAELSAHFFIRPDFLPFCSCSYYLLPAIIFHWAYWENVFHLSSLLNKHRSSMFLRAPFVRLCSCHRKEETAVQPFCQTV